jgi:glycosyltransferase involved in cell wall biosynthesis
MACVAAETRLGHEATLINVDDPSAWQSEAATLADLHVVHSHFPDIQYARVKNRTGKPPTIVFCAHGIPEHNVELAVQNYLGPEQYRPIDHWMLTREWLRSADAFVCFSPRQHAIYQTLAQKGRVVDLVPLGVDTAFWAGGTFAGERMQGQPSVWMSENQARIKWALDVLIAWPWVCEAIPQAFLHAHYIPFDMQRFLIDLANSNGAAMRAVLTARTFSHETLRNLWKGCDFMLATTRYGDNTCLTMQAEAAGLKTISYTGNQYASYWMPEGDQRMMAVELIRIFAGETPMRDKTPVPDLADMGRAMVAVYERVLGRVIA